MNVQHEALLSKFKTLWAMNPSLSFMEVVRLVSDGDERANLWAVSDTYVEQTILQRLKRGV